MKLNQYLTNVGGAISQLANVVFLFGHPNESISGRSHREPWPRMERFVNAIFFLQKDHCKKAYDSDVRWAKDLTESDSKRCRKES